ncbi:10934_t:CDS:2 [Diversispora eburnea]|uniref:10934_t:CDS:1 n=1 Tax=Diversispora eburnea TaxID=1213867 RepID=A0A9N8YY73_9GLOM|nr:10934_t:CDS:2 [Diversispora eburnea]
METKISTEILNIILKNVQSSLSTQDLYSSLLVNRFWCEATAPILWEIPLGQEFNWENLRRKALCIRTYISCMDNQDRTLLTQNDQDDYIIPKSRILFLELVINRCTFLDKFKLVEVPDIFIEKFHNYNDLIGKILDLPDAPKVLKKLESFTSTIRNYENFDDQICQLYELLKLICDNILNMDLFLVSDLQEQFLVELISFQKLLENLSIVKH